MGEPPTLPVARGLTVLVKSTQDEGTMVEHLQKWKRSYSETGSGRLLTESLLYLVPDDWYPRGKFLKSRFPKDKGQTGRIQTTSVTSSCVIPLEVKIYPDIWT